jgi:hypothetical protein
MDGEAMTSPKQSRIDGLLVPDDAVSLRSKHRLLKSLNVGFVAIVSVLSQSGT